MKKAPKIPKSWKSFNDMKTEDILKIRDHINTLLWERDATEILKAHVRAKEAITSATGKIDWGELEDDDY